MKDYEFLAKLMEDWDGYMGVESVQATVYTYVLHEFLMSLFHIYAPNHPSNRVSFLDAYPQTEFILTLLNSIAKEGTNPKYMNICKGAYPEYEGKNICGYNVAAAFSKAKKFLEQNISTNPDNWKWGNVHVVYYSNMPWTLTPMKGLFDRQVKAGGNSNTPHVSKYQLTKNVGKSMIYSDLTPTYKQLIQFE